MNTIPNRDKKAKGDVHIKNDLCKGCGFCIEFCPLHILAFSLEFNLKGYHPPILIDDKRCSGCDLCGIFCPDFAIYATKNVSISENKP